MKSPHASSKTLMLACSPAVVEWHLLCKASHKDIYSHGSFPVN